MSCAGDRLLRDASNLRWFFGAFLSVFVLCCLISGCAPGQKKDISCYFDISPHENLIRWQQSTPSRGSNAVLQRPSGHR